MQGTVETEAKEYAPLEVSRVQAYPFKEGNAVGHVVGIATVELNGQFLVRGIRVMSGDNGRFVAFPADPFWHGTDDEPHRSVCCPTSVGLRERIEAAVLAEFDREGKEG